MIRETGGCEMRREQLRRDKVKDAMTWHDVT